MPPIAPRICSGAYPQAAPYPGGSHISTIHARRIRAAERLDA